jgi:hypothetical protein
MTDHSVDSVSDRSRFCFRCLIDVKRRGRSCLAGNRIEWRTPSGSRRFADREGPWLVAKRALQHTRQLTNLLRRNIRIPLSLGPVVCPVSTSTPLMKKKKTLPTPPRVDQNSREARGTSPAAQGMVLLAGAPSSYEENTFSPQI